MVASSRTRSVRTVEAQRAYDEGYRQALLDALKQRDIECRPARRFDPHRKIGGPDSPFKPRGVPGSIYND
jgi:hypothetical protein